MEIYIVKIDKQAEKDIEKIAKSGNKSDIKRFEKIFEQLAFNPRFGVGNPERLKHYEGEVWSRQLNKKDRIVYEILEQKIVVIIVSALGHYKDK